MVATREDRRQLTRHLILRAALVEFGRGGLDGATVKTISERAGVANGTVFWHFESKARLYVGAVELAADRFYKALMPVANGASFMHIIDNALAFLQANPEVDMLLSSLRGEHPRPAVAEAARLVDSRAVDLWRCWIARSQSAGDLAPPGISDANLARLIAATVSGVLATRLLEKDSGVRTVLADFATLIEPAPVAHSG
jgi:AcrR family transcriptional regulator